MIKAELKREGVTIFEEDPIHPLNYRNIVQQRWQELQALTINTNDRPPKPYTELSQRTEVIPDGFVFTFAHREMYFDSWPDGSKSLQKFYTTEGYLLRSNHFFRLQANGQRDRTAMILEQLQVRQKDVLPSSPDFCGKDAFFPGTIPSLGEGLFFAFRLPDSKAELRIRLPTGEPPYPPIDGYDSDTFKAHLIRDAALTTHGMEGRARVISSSNEKYQSINNRINARWYFPGPVPGYANLGIQFDFSYTTETTEPPPHFGRLPPRTGEHDLDEATFLALWDGIMHTFSLRPGAL